LLTFATAPWYPSYGTRTAPWGLTPLEDQQLAGVIMWVPAGVVYLGAALGLMTVWISRPPATRVASRELGAIVLHR
jgi:cytochrome c oxidase assembly factor CtaG